MVHCAFGKSFCVAMAHICAVVCRIFRRSSDSALVRSLIGGATTSTAAASFPPLVSEASATAFSLEFWF
jgi:hypothetical protein